LIWDFDGTLGYRAGRWASALHAVLEEAMPGHDLERELLAARVPSAGIGAYLWPERDGALYYGHEAHMFS
jgi:hypothetical protein